MFNPEAFANTVVEGAMSTRLELVPIGEYNATIDKFVVRPTTPDGSTPCDFFYSIQDENLKAQLGRPKITVKGNVWLDITEAGGLDNGKGKNVSLGKIREAVGQNDPAKPWSPSMLLNQLVRVKVGHNPSKKDGEIYDGVLAVTKA